MQGNIDFELVTVNVLDPQGFCEECGNTQLNSANLDLSEGTFIATETIVSDATVPDGATTLYQAGESITLTPGFHAEAGSDFTARIGECAPSTLSNPAEQRNNSAIIPSLKEADMKVSPNPFQQHTLVTFTLTKTSETSLVILSSCLLYTSPSPRDATLSRMPSSA